MLGAEHAGNWHTMPPDSWQEQWGDKQEDGLILRLLWTDQGVLIDPYSGARALVT